MVGGMCIVLPYGTGICCYVFIFFFFVVIASVHSFFIYFLKSSIDKSTEWSTIPARPSLMCFFNRGDTEGTNSSKILCSMFLYVLFYVNLCTGLILWFLNDFWFDDVRAESIRDRLNIVFSRDVILCG